MGIPSPIRPPVDEPRRAVQPERGHPRGELEHPGENDVVPEIRSAQDGLRDSGAAGSGLLGDGDELRAGDQQGHQPGQRGRPQLRHRRTPDQPRHQRGARQDDHQHGHLLISQHRPAGHHPQDHRPPPPRPPRQPHRGLQRQRQEQHPRRQVQVIPGPPRQHRRQPEKRPRRDRAQLRGQPQPRHPVHRITQQARHHDRQQVVRGTRPEQHRDRHHHHARQRHQRMQPQLSPRRSIDVTGKPRITQMLHLPRDPPEPPHVTTRITRRRQPARQIRHPRPAHRDPRRHKTSQHRQLNRHRTTNHRKTRNHPNPPRPPPPGPASSPRTGVLTAASTPPAVTPGRAPAGVTGELAAGPGPLDAAARHRPPPRPDRPGQWSVPGRRPAAPAGHCPPGPSVPSLSSSRARLTVVLR